MSERLAIIIPHVPTATLVRACIRLDFRKHVAKVAAIDKELQQRLKRAA